jgi:hypothetical protein
MPLQVISISLYRSRPSAPPLKAKISRATAVINNPKTYNKRSAELKTKVVELKLRQEENLKSDREEDALHSLPPTAMARKTTTILAILSSQKIHSMYSSCR